MNRTPAACTLIAGASAVSAAAFLAVAGPLNPPAGAVAPTYKTLQQVEPRTDVATLPSGNQSGRRITQPGSYYLSGPVVINTPTGGGGELNGISIEADDVTLDLNGFNIDNTGTVSSSGAGVQLAGVRSRITIKNGSVSRFLAGIGADDDSSVRITDVSIGGTGTYGIWAGAGAVITGCQVRSGVNAGVQAGPGSIIADCSVAGPAGVAYQLGDSSSATGCSAVSPGGPGFALSDGCSLTRCTVANPGGASPGISAANNTSILDCNVRGGQLGIELAGGGNRVERCKIGNALVGLHSAFANTIVDNTLNAAGSVTGQGIVVAGSDNRVERNHIYTFGEGIRVDASFNVVTSNNLHFVGNPISGGGIATSIIAATVNTAAGLAANPTANTVQ
jgi:hypothetical protein